MSQPLTRFASGRVQLSVWENEGAKGRYHSIRIANRYRDSKTGEWKDSGRFFPGELSALQGLIQQALDFLGNGERPGGRSSRPALDPVEEGGRGQRPF